MAVKKKQGRPAKVAKPQPAKDTEEQTPIRAVKIAKKEPEETPLRKGDRFLFIKDGREVYMTRSVANTLLIRNSASIVIPKGSEYIPPKDSKCDGC